MRKLRAAMLRREAGFVDVQSNAVKAALGKLSKLHDLASSGHNSCLVQTHRARLAAGVFRRVFTKSGGLRDPRSPRNETICREGHVHRRVYGANTSPTRV